MKQNVAEHLNVLIKPIVKCITVNHLKVAPITVVESKLVDFGRFNFFFSKLVDFGRFNNPPKNMTIGMNSQKTTSLI